MNGKRRFADSARKAFVFLVAPFLLVALTGTARPAPAACPVAVAGAGLISVAYAGAPAVPARHVRLTFAGHASFLIETPGGASVFTDYNGYVRPPRLPDIVTMNNFHDTHYTDYVEPEIRFVLRGWDPSGGIARHNLAYRDARIRNVPTNIAEFGGKTTNGNSIFVVEAAGLCVAHLSHLHHVLSRGQVRELGRIDVLLAPIDGAWTMSHEEVMHVIAQIKPRLVIPMHYGSEDSVGLFLALAKQRYPIKRHGSDTLLVSLRTLPRSTEVLFLAGE